MASHKVSQKRDETEEPLGVKHKIYNDKVNEAIADNKTLDERVFKPIENDLDNLMKIDLASKRKDIDYIVSVLKSKDMLYVSRALNKSKWLVDDNYVDIINPQLLRDRLFPIMTTKAGIKLTKFVRQHLKNESRVEDFFNSESNPKVAAKWLSRCSIPFIENHIQTCMAHLDLLELKLLCEKSVSIFEAATKDNEYNCSRILKAASFLINTHLDKYLDAVERVHKYERVKFNAKATDMIMKQNSIRIKDKFDVYSALVHIPTFVKHFKSEDVKEFLYKQVEGKDNCQPLNIFKYDLLKMFVSRMPKDKQFEFVTNLFIDKAILLVDENTIARGSEMYFSKLLCQTVCNVTPSYVWYEFAPFELAFSELKKLIHTEIRSSNKYLMLNVMVTCAAGNMQHLQSVFTYYSTQHVKDYIPYKNKFISLVASCTDITTYDDATWMLLDKILTSMDVYAESTETEQICLEIVTVYNSITNKPIPEVVEKKFPNPMFTLQNYEKKLSNENGMKIFQYLYNHAKATIEKIEINNQEDLGKSIACLDYFLSLLVAWKKDLTDYPFVLEQIKNAATIKRENNWKSDLNILYSKNKSWRKLMFEESIVLHPSDDVCVNALKHDPALLKRYKDEVEAVCCDDAVSLSNWLKKLRIYWAGSLAADWSKSYITRLNKLGNHKALVQGLCTILPKNELDSIVKKYAPSEAKINWSNTDELSLSLQRSIAEIMHIARPQPSPADILLYAKGDYLQYALPSLLAVFYNLSRADSKEHVPKLLDTPVSLQKHAIRFAFVKLEHIEIKQHIAHVWNTSKNSSVRTVIFELMFKLLKEEKNDRRAMELWELLEVFIDNLNYQEDDKIYQLLARVGDLPLCVRPYFLTKSYKFLKSLIQNTKYNSSDHEYNVDRLAEYTREIMESMSPEFVAEIITEFINDKFFCKSAKYQSEVRLGSGLVPVLTSFLLCGSEDIQMQRYEALLAPLTKRSLDMWNETNEGSYFIRIHYNVVLKSLIADLNEVVIPKKVAIPTKMFVKIQHELQNLPLSENYLMLSMWQMTTKLSELIEKSKENDWHKICLDITPQFSKFCLEALKIDVNSYFSCIYVLFSKALDMVIKDFPMNVQLQIFEQMLSDVEFLQAYFATMKIFPRYGSDDETSEKILELKKIMKNHPSVEVKMHFYCNFETSRDIFW